MAKDARPYRYKLLALLGVGLLGLSVFTVVASYTQLFVPVVNAEVIADRSGLLLDPKADVTMHGMTVGEARTIEAVDGGAHIGIAIESEYADIVPADVGARIIAPTVFGPKFVDLVPSETPSAQPIQGGTVIRASQVDTETNMVFDSLMNLLTNVKPSKINATLGAAATALRGRGERIGAFLTDLNTYLTRFNPTLPDVDRDLRALPDVTGTYADVAPEVTKIADNASTLSRTLQDKEAGLHAMLVSLTRASGTGTQVLRDNGERLVTALNTLRPTTELLAYYAPEFPCMFGGVNDMRRSSAATVGGLYNGIRGIVTFMPGQEGYQRGVDDPKLVEGGPPKCYPTMVAHGPYHSFDDGSNSFDPYRTKTRVMGPGELAKAVLGPSIEKYLGGDQ